MKKHKKIIIIKIIIALIIICMVTFIIIKNKSTNSFEDNRKDMHQFMNGEIEIPSGEMPSGEMPSEEMSDKANEQAKNRTTLSTTAEVTSALTENIELHATYYLEETYIEKNEFVTEGENILKYTNGTYLVAPYDCYIISLNLPDLEGQVLNSHNIEISSSNSLMVNMSIDETYINDISIGTEVTIEITALEKTYTGNITHVASTGSNGKFEIKIEFENDGDIMLGMTANITLVI